MAFSNWILIQKAYVKQDWAAIEAIYEADKTCPHTYSAYKHAMSIFAFPKCVLPNEPIKQKPLTNSAILDNIAKELGVKLAKPRKLNDMPKAQLIGHIWWHWQNKAFGTSHKELSKIADTIAISSKIEALAKYFDKQTYEFFNS